MSSLIIFCSFATRKRTARHQLRQLAAKGPSESQKDEKLEAKLKAKLFRQINQLKMIKINEEMLENKKNKGKRKKKIVHDDVTDAERKNKNKRKSISENWDNGKPTKKAKNK